MARSKDGQTSPGKRTVAEYLANYTERDGILFPSDHAPGDFNYSDGDESENYLLDLIKKTPDRSLFSQALVAGIRDWPSLYHLSPKRANLLRPFNQRLRGRVLEIGAGCGALTRFLGENGGNIVAVEGSERRARIARLRTHDLNNVQVVCDRYENLSPSGSFDVVLAIGVLEYAGIYGLDKDNPHIGFLARLREHLAPDGILILAIENQLGLKYFAGAREDHTRTPFYGISGSYRKDSVVTFGKDELSQLFSQAGLPSQAWFIPCPDYKLPNSVLSEELTSAEPQLAAALVAQATLSDPQKPQDPLFSLEQGWKILGRNKLLLELANSFLIVAGRSGKAVHSNPPEDFAWHYSVERHPAFTKETRFTKIGKTFAVKRQPLSEAQPPPVPISMVAADEPLYAGQNWHTALVEIINRPGWNVAQIVQWAKVWTDALARECGFASLDSKNFFSLVDGAHFDATPFNMIRTSDGHTQFFDQEWRLKPQVELGYLVVRGLRSSLRISSCAPPAAETPSNILQLITLVLGHLGILVTRAEIDRYILMESQVQAWVQGRAASDMTPEKTSELWDSSLRVRAPAEPNELIKERQRLIAEIDKLRLEHQQNESRRLNLETALKDARQEIERATLGYQASESKVANLTRDLQAARDYLRESQTRLQGLSGDLSTTRDQYALLESKHANLSAHVASLEQAMRISDAAAEEHKALVDELRTAKAKAETLYANEVARVATLSRDITQTAAERDKNLAKLKQLTSTLKWVQAQSGLLQSTILQQSAALNDRKSAREILSGLGSAALARFLRRQSTIDLQNRAWEIDAIRASKLFDELDYLRRYPDVAKADYDPLSHYIAYGAAEHRSANALFDSGFYLAQHPEVSEAKMTALAHYVSAGSAAGFDPHPLFDAGWYLRQNPDVAAASVNPLRHYMEHGWREGRDPHPLFDTSWYLEQNPDVAAAGENPLVHYLAHGWKEGRDPHPMFDTSFYLDRNSDVASEEQNPLVHFVLMGWRENRDPSPNFDTAFYLKKNPDVAAAEINPLVHFCLHGMKEGRKPQRELSSAVTVAATTAAPKRAATRQATFDFETEAKWIEQIRAHPAYSRAHSKRPLVSVVMPTRDRLPLLRKAIDSVSAQSYDNWELLVVDDGSTDGTPDAVRIIRDPRIKLLHSGGANVSAARNVGLKAASGDIIAYLDSDDVWLPDYLSLMVAEFERSGAETFYAALRVDGDSGSASFYRSRPFSFEDLVQENFISLITFAHRRSVYHRLGGFDTSLRRMVDWDLVLRYTSKFPPTFAPFLCAIADNSSSRTRVTTTAGIHYKYIIQNKYLIDWKKLKDQSKSRDPALVSIIICVYDQPDFTEQCLNSVLSARYNRPIEIVVVDNGSATDTKRILQSFANRDSRIRLVTNPENFNFALGNNLGFAASRGANLVFLNNDTRVSENWLEPLVAALKKDGIKGAQPRLDYPDGSVQCIGVVFSDQSVLGYPIYVNQDNPPVKSRAYRAITAACMAVRAADFASVEGFDPNFINGQEDIDFCLRLANGDNAFWVETTSVVTHYEGRTQGRGKNIEHNRATFVDRWKGRIGGDDQRFYFEDGYRAEDHAPDRADFSRPDLAIWKPRRLVLQDPRRRSGAAGTDIKMSDAATRLKIAIKCPAPSLDEAPSWGDFHFAKALSRALGKQGFQTRIDVLPDWYGDQGFGDDVVIVLRGLSRYTPRPHQINLCWLISHPESVGNDELETYHHVFVASTGHAETLKRALTVPVTELLQCSDPALFYPPTLIEPSLQSDLLFVGNSRKQRRTSVMYSVERGLPISVYGKNWDNLIPAHFVKGEFVPNEQLNAYYRNAKIVLNDHWPDMAARGFVSNRIFDIALSGGFVISDDFSGKEIFQDHLVTYSDAGSLEQAVHHWLRDDEGRHQRAMNLMRIVLQHHTFEHRAERIVATIHRELMERASASG